MKYHNITRDDMLNGDGLRVVLWLSGCSHKCKGCQNPLTWDPNNGLDFDDTTKAELFDALSKSYISGITFSGGDPLYEANRNEVSALIDEIRSLFPNKTIWLYTGYLWEEIYDLPLIKNIDVCVDGEFVAELKDTKLLWKGSSNQRVIDVKKTFAENAVNHPIIHCPDYY